MLFNFEYSESLDIRGVPVRQVLTVRGNIRPGQTIAITTALP